MTKENEDVLKAISTSELSGGVLPRDLFDEFFVEVQDESTVIDRVRTVTLQREKMRIPKLGVGERKRKSQSEGTSISTTQVTTDSIDMDAEKGAVYWELTKEAVEDVVDDVPNIVMDVMTRQFAVDTEELAFIGDEGDGDDFIGQNDGWIEILEDENENVLDWENNEVDSELFHDTIQELDAKYLRTNPVFIMNLKQLQEYSYHLTDREGGLGDAVLFGNQELNPFGYDIIGTALIPEDKALFTPQDNLIYGLYREVEVDVLEQSDDIHEKDLFAKYCTRVRDDFQVEDPEGAVLVENIASI